MSVAERTTSKPTRGVERSLCGWGGTSPSRARVTRARSAEEVAEVLAGQRPAAGGVIARGAGRSYGDAAQNGGGDVIDVTGLDRILSVDPGRRLITAQAGVTVAQLMVGLARHGLGLPVVPGTRYITLAGAIASDIHGKNHHRDGGFGRHVCSLSLCTPTGGCVEVSPEADPELFHATLGGMGLTGVIVQATLRVEPLAAPWVLADVDRTEGFEQTLALMAGKERHRYSVAWLDLLAGGQRMGRAVVSRADSWPSGRATEPPRGLGRMRGPYPASLTRRPVLDVPSGFPAALLRPAGVRAFNALHWRTAPRRERERPLALAPYFFPLDGLGKWNRLYGSAGMIQYQLVIPVGREAALLRCVELLRTRRLPVYLAVFKRLGAASGGPLSFPLDGWTLAIDLPAAWPGLRWALDELDELVAGSGGRVYLSKDARLGRDAMAAMYPELDRFHDLRARVDPDGVLRSDLSRRLGL
jgi:decaprenylphospho-beta-D-ribofuranose 2-oxidase